MRMDFMLLLHATVYVVLVHFAFGTSTCLDSTDSTSSRHIKSFDSLPPSSEHAFGCATDSITVDGDIYRENHVIYVESDRAADIYLNVNGIHRRTTNTLPHYKEYKYEFALSAKQSVMWLVSSVNQPPNSTVSFKFYLTSGSHVVFRDGRSFSSVLMGMEDRQHMTSQDILTSLKRSGIFHAQEITSFTEISPTQVATVNVSVGIKQDAALRGNFVACSHLQKDYHSPIVNVELYKTNKPLLTCEQKDSEPDITHRKRAFVLDITDKPHAQERTRTINLEIVGTEATGGGNRLIVLISNFTVHWRLNVEKIDAKQRPLRDLKFVVSRNSKLTFGNEYSGEHTVEFENFDYDENNSTIIRNSIEAVYGSTIVSYSKYITMPDLVFLKLKVDDGSSVDDTEVSRQQKAFALYLKSACDDADGIRLLTVTMDTLKQFGIEKQALELSSNGSVCSPLVGPAFLMYDLTECSKNSVDGSVEVKVTFPLKKSDHLFTTPGVKNTPVTMLLKGCQKQENRVEPGEPPLPDPTSSPLPSTIDLACMTGLLVVRIPNSLLETLDLSQISKCDSHSINDRTEYRITDSGFYSCGATFGDKMNSVKIPRKPLDNGTAVEPIQKSCLYSNGEVEMKYSLKAFDDFNLKNELVKTVMVDISKKNTDATTYHFQLLAIADDSKWTAFLSQCTFGDGPNSQLLIRNNCPVSDSVSFVRSSSRFSNYTQHFVVKIGNLIKGNLSRNVVCEVSACALDPCDHCIPTVPQCAHLHGDGCINNDIDVGTLPRYSEDTVSSPLFSADATVMIRTLGPRPEKDKDCDKKDDNELISSSEITTNKAVLVVLALAAFTLGCLLVTILTCIQRRYPNKQTPPRAATKSECDGSGESGSSRSTGSTKTSGSSFGSLFCLKTEKPTSSPSSSKDDLEMERKPFLFNTCATTSAKQQPHFSDVRSEFISSKSIVQNGSIQSSSQHDEIVENWSNTIQVSLPPLTVDNDWRVHAPDMQVIEHQFPNLKEAAL